MSIIQSFFAVVGAMCAVVLGVLGVALAILSLFGTPVKEEDSDV